MNRLILNAFFSGEPVTWKRANGFGNRRFNDKYMEGAKKKLRRQLTMIAPNLKPDDRARFGFQAVFSMPPGKRGDGDNLEKLVFDAFNGRIWQDDEQIDEWQGRKTTVDPRQGELGIHLIVYVIDTQK